MDQEVIYQSVSKIRPYDRIEAQHKEDALRWIRSGVELRRLEKPATPPKHLVSYSVLLDPKVNALLLVDHKQAQLWLPPGGHVELGEHPLETAQRELREELNTSLALVQKDPVFLTVTETVGLTAGHVDVSLWYVFAADSSVELRYDRTEFNAVQWFPLDGLPLSRTDPHLSRFCEKLSKSNIQQ